MTSTLKDKQPATTETPDTAPRHRTQAERIIAKFGNARNLAKLLGKDPASVYRWTHPVAKGGTGGLIPSSAMIKVMKAARAEGVLLTVEDLYPGKS